MTATAPSCPLCGHNDTVTRVASPNGDFYCSCGTLFDGTDPEWRRWATERRRRIERPMQPKEAS